MYFSKYKYPDIPPTRKYIQCDALYSVSDKLYLYIYESFKCFLNLFLSITIVFYKQYN